MGGALSDGVCAQFRAVEPKKPPILYNQMADSRERPALLCRRRVRMRSGGAIPRLTVGESLLAPGTGKVQGQGQCETDSACTPPR